MSPKILNPTLNPRTIVSCAPKPVRRDANRCASHVTGVCAATWQETLCWSTAGHARRAAGLEPREAAGPVTQLWTRLMWRRQRCGPLS